MNVEASDISAAEQCKRENCAKQTAAMACHMPLFEFGEDNSNDVEEESFDDSVSYDPKICNSAIGSMCYKSYECSISIDKAPMEADVSKVDLSSYLVVGF